jgi:YjbE family integral membrane protein
MEYLQNPAFWTAFGSIIVADILLSGDNAVVIALATRSLPPEQQRRAIIFGSGAAIMMRVVLTIMAAALLTYPFLKLIGGLLLLHIGVGLMTGGDEGEGDIRPAGVTMGAAIRTILMADLVMSLDNVIAVAAAAKGDMLLLILGLAISIPFIVFGSTMLLKVMQKYPIIITFGAALLGFLAGEMMLTDPAVQERLGEVPKFWVTLSGLVGAVLVVLLGKWKLRR